VHGGGIEIITELTERQWQIARLQAHLSLRIE
jgi:hypothetical protein